MNVTYQNYNEEFQTQVTEFGGLNRNIWINENEFSDMLNMTSDCYPLLSPRKKRTTVKVFEEGEVVTGFTNKGALVYTVQSNGSTKIYINGSQVSGVTLTTGEKNIVGMGCYVVIFPDNYYLNVLDTSDKGYLGQRTEIEATVSQPVVLTPCMFDGTEFDSSNVSASAPENPVNGQVWIDTSGDITVYKVWDESTGAWQQESTVYIKISHSGIGTGFSQWDGVSISGITYSGNDTTLAKQIEALNLDSALLQQRGDNFLEIAAIINQQVTITSGNIIIERKIPQLDFVTECNNRLWGCHFGVSGGKAVNEILACKQGDPKNWYSYPGVSTDSYAMSLGTDGPFTGAITYLNAPIFFKENFIHKIYGEMPSSFYLSVTNASGVGRDYPKSVVTDGSAVFYRSAKDFCIYTGSYPVAISKKLNDFRPDKIISGCLGDKLYFYVEKGEEKFILTYDTQLDMWHKEDSNEIKAFTLDGHILYFLEVDDEGIYRIKSVNEDYGVTLVDLDAPPAEEDDFEWFAESGDIGFGDPDAKHLKKLKVRARLSEGSVLKVEVSYDGKEYRDCFELIAEEGNKVVSNSIRPVRNEDFRLRFSGKGDVKILTITKEFIRGSDKP